MKFKVNYICDDFIKVYEYITYVSTNYYNFIYVTDEPSYCEYNTYNVDTHLITDIFII